MNVPHDISDDAFNRPGLRRAIVGRLMVYAIPGLCGAAIGLATTFARHLGIGPWDVLRSEIILPVWAFAAFSAAGGSLLIQSSASPAKDRMEVGVALASVSFLAALGTGLALWLFVN